MHTYVRRSYVQHGEPPPRYFPTQRYWGEWPGWKGHGPTMQPILSSSHIFPYKILPCLSRYRACLHTESFLINSMCGQSYSGANQEKLIWNNSICRQVLKISLRWSDLSSLLMAARSLLPLPLMHSAFPNDDAWDSCSWICKWTRSMHLFELPKPVLCFWPQNWMKNIRPLSLY